MADDFEEARRIIRDPSHPLHSDYHSGDPEARAKVEAGYKSKYGVGDTVMPRQSETELSPDLQAIKERYEAAQDGNPSNPGRLPGVHFSESQPQDGPPAKSIPEAIADADRKDAELMQFFREQSGANFEEDFAACCNKLGTMFSSREAVDEAVHAVGGEKAALELLLNLVRSERQ
jgi:hypothetical protein